MNLTTQPSLTITTPEAMPGAAPGPALAYGGDGHTLVLPISGQTVKVTRRRSRVIDADKALAMAGKHPSNLRIMAARVAVFSTREDGGCLTFEEVMGWYEDDMAAVIELRGDEAFVLPPARTSSSSPTSPAGA